MRLGERHSGFSRTKAYQETRDDEATAQMLLEIHKRIVEETVSMNLAFDYEGLDEEVAQVLLEMSYYGERHREHLTPLR
jgi:hypothetical protein